MKDLRERICAARKAAEAALGVKLATARVCGKPEDPHWGMSGKTKEGDNYLVTFFFDGNELVKVSVS